MKTTCADCGKTWGGYRASHCTACHQSFSSESAGDSHRRGEYPDGRHCITEHLVHDAKRDVWKNPGSWFPAPRSEQDGPSTPETTTGTPDTILSRHRAGTETP